MVATVAWEEVLVGLGKRHVKPGVSVVLAVSIELIPLVFGTAAA